MAICFEESVVYDSQDVIVTLNAEEGILTFWRLIDTRFIDPNNESALEAELQKESAEQHRTTVVMEPSGYAKIYRQDMDVRVYHNQEETISEILKEMRAA